MRRLLIVGPRTPFPSESVHLCPYGGKGFQFPRPVQKAEAAATKNLKKFLFDVQKKENKTRREHSYSTTSLP